MRRYLIQAAVILALSSSLTYASKTDGNPFDPLQELRNAFPHTVEFRNRGMLLEFCPDGTCDGFVASKGVPVSALKDFGYLFEYFFSDYTFLGDWRETANASAAADKVLSRPQYAQCKNDAKRETARCVLNMLSHEGKIRLVFVRYDEGQRHELKRNLEEFLSKSGSNRKP